MYNKKEIARIAECNGYSVKYATYKGYSDTPYVENPMGQKTWLCEVVSTAGSEHLNLSEFSPDEVMYSIYYGYNNIGELKKSYKGGE